MAELFKALSEGKKVRKSYWPDGSFVHIVDGKVTDNHGGTPIVANFLDADSWEIFIEPKKPTKLYAYIEEEGDSYVMYFYKAEKGNIYGGIRMPQFDTEVVLEN